MPPPKPSIKSFLLADHVFRQDTGKWCVIGVFSKIWTPVVPMVHLSLGVFVVLADAQGEYDVRLEVRDPNDRVVSSVQGVRFGILNRLDQAEFGLQTSQLPLPSWGRYFFRLYFNGEAAEQDATLDVEKLEVPHA